MAKKNNSTLVNTNKKKEQQAILQEGISPQRSFQSAQGSPEVVALVTGKLSESSQQRALDIIEKRVNNEEKERERQYKAFSKTENINFFIFVLVFLALIGLDIFLYAIGNSQTANYLTTAIVSLAIGFFGGWGYEKSKQ